MASITLRHQPAEVLLSVGFVPGSRLRTRPEAEEVIHRSERAVARPLARVPAGSFLLRADEVIERRREFTVSAPSRIGMVPSVIR
jgi:hypothetical protein